MISATLRMAINRNGHPCMPRNKKKKFYAVAVGNTPGIYTEWYGDNGAEIQVRGFSGAVFKGFTTRKEAEDFFRENEGKKSNKVKPKASPTKPRASSTSKPATKPKTASGDSGIVIYTDGGCSPSNPGPGGYGVVIMRGKKKVKELSGGYRFTTNNRMELMACIVGLGFLKRPSNVILHSDSKYVVNGITKGWAERWRANGWMKNKREAAVNPDLWKKLLELCEKHDVRFEWVKGHAGNMGNERCDQLANREAAKKRLPADKGYEKKGA
jgi:ribonuclease HI